MLQQYVLPCFDAPAGHVRAKACWVAQQYADVKFAEGRGRGAHLHAAVPEDAGAPQRPRPPGALKPHPQALVYILP